MRWVLLFVTLSALLLLVASVFGLLGGGEQVAALAVAAATTYGLRRWSARL